MILLDSDVMIDLLRQCNTFNQRHYQFIPELQTTQPYNKTS